MDGSSKCPVMHGSITNNDKNKSTSNKDWWPNQLNLSILRQHDKRSNPMNLDLFLPFLAGWYSERDGFCRYLRTSAEALLNDLNVHENGNLTHVNKDIILQKMAL